MGIDILLPERLSEMPLCRYQEFVKVKNDSNDNEFIAQKMIQIFCGLKLEEVAKIKVVDLNQIIMHFHQMFKEKPQLVRQFKIKNIEFGFIPKLDDLTFGEYVDLEHYLKDWETYHKAMAIMYRPIKEKYKDKYSIVDYKPNEDMQELMKFAPLDVAISASVFFWNLGKELLQALSNFLQKNLKQMTNSRSIPKEVNLENIGDGIQASMRYLKEILQTSIMSQDYHLLNVSPILHSKNKKGKLKTVN